MSEARRRRRYDPTKPYALRRIASLQFWQAWRRGDLANAIGWASR